ncbi:carboxypeptidase-like regulatory domain-containing protein [Pseudobacter ginsenosidimutans]|uniref:Carboxypeptidase family protein n=1 Tax=Pseudobacter ginsenosidimutans TaxID=661488 RepID=A0A4Q7N5M1_9BACT|nr:carboxypeptidase-like regulatory domain-containing protein [Pseudobacter ginsenosidimutans]QEC44857.1 hypothetical protein FSB84_25440 [Pseudobacter ginsenosidimutans]RZS76348.1 hypothetical protein EV199_2231 [Pseudobacter ginsenosidimutans]
MKSKLLIPALLAYTLIQGIACNKSDSVSNPDPVTPPPSPWEKVVTSVSGRIFDEVGLPVNGAVVTAGTSTATTDINGSFSFKDASLYKSGGFISVEKSGYLAGKRTFQVESKDQHYVSIRLIKKQATQTFNAGSGGTITAADGTTLKFEPGSILNASNNSNYTGTVTILFQIIDPTNPDFAENQPGSVLARSRAGNLYGTMARNLMYVELTGSNGEKLKLNEAMPATFTLPIAPAEFDAAPATLTISSLNDSTGVWQEESIVLKQLNGYLGKVNHFSYWNFHTNFNYAEVTAIIKTPGNISVPHAFVSLGYTFENRSAASYGYSDTAGVVKLIMPRNAIGELEVKSRCGDLLHEANLGKIGVSKTLDTIRIAYAPGTITFTGTAVNCSANPVANGQVYITVDNQTYTAAVTNGNYSLQIIRCSGTSTSANIKVVDLSNSQFREVSKTVTTGNVTVDPIEVCVP